MIDATFFPFYLFIFVWVRFSLLPFSLVATSGVYSLAVVQEQQFIPAPGFDPWVGKIPWRREWLPTPVFLPGEFHGIYSPRGRQESDTTEQLSLTHSCIPGDASGKEAATAVDIRDLGLIPGSGRLPGEGNGNPLQYSCLENPMDRGAWWVTVHGVAKSQTWLKWLFTHPRAAPSSQLTWETQ